MHISLDGYVAGSSGELNWVQFNDEIFDHVTQRIKKTNSALYGRVTYEMMQDYWPNVLNKPDATQMERKHAKWYINADKFVISKSLQNAKFENTKIISNNFLDNILALKNTTPDEILLFGSPSATQLLLKENLIDEFWLFLNPVVLGSGIQLFKNQDFRSVLELGQPPKSFNNGVVELRYKLNR